MPGYPVQAETTRTAPTTEELLNQFAAERDARYTDRVVLPQEIIGPLRPLSIEESERQAKALARAALEFRLAWDARTEEMQAARVQSNAENNQASVTDIASKQPLLDSVIGSHVMQQAS